MRAAYHGAMQLRLRPTALLALVLVALWGSAFALPRTQDAQPQVEVAALGGPWKRLPLGTFRLTAMDAANARVRFPGNAAELPTAGFTVQRLSGDVVHGTIAGGSDEALELRVRGGAALALSIESIRSLRAVDLRDQVGLDAPDGGDRLWRRVGEAFDRIDGLLVAFGPAGVTFEGQLGEREYTWNEVGALWIEPLGELEDESGGVGVTLVDGSRLHGGFQRIENGKLFLDVGADAALVLDTSGVLELDIDDERLAFVADLPFVDVGAPGLFGDDLGLVMPPQRDRSVVGSPLAARGRVFARGLGVHAPSTLRLEWKAGGTLRGAVAIDDSVEQLMVDGSVVFRVRVDGERVFESKELTVNSALVELPAIDLEGHSVIELEVAEASQSVMGDRANWLDLRITQDG